MTRPAHGATCAAGRLTTPWAWADVGFGSFVDIQPPHLSALAKRHPSLHPGTTGWQQGSGDMFDFDRVIDRRGTHASKWENMAKLSGIDAPEALPMWVADMDFAAPPGVTDALMAMAEHGVYGYYANTGSWAAALTEWMRRRHNVDVDPAWVSPTPGVVSGLGLILQATSEPGDEVVVFPARLPCLSPDHSC
ncbi:MAG: hypothetical protein WDO24_27795 [Pseudomonadota bacterium]